MRKQLDLTLAHGHTPASPIMLANYAIVLVFTGDRAGSQRFGEVALALAEREEFREAHPHTLFIYLHFIRHWKDPVRENLSRLRDAIGHALDQGDQEFAGYQAAALLSQSFWVGRPLAEIDALAQSLIPGIRSQPTPATLCQAVQQICLNLMGRSEDAFPARRRERLRRTGGGARRPPRKRRRGTQRGGDHETRPALLVGRLCRGAHRGR